MAVSLTPDLCVVGAGIAGLAVARAARRLGVDVVLVDPLPPGGQALRAGQLALDALRAAADKAHAIRSGAAFGVSGDEPKVNFRRVHDHIAAVLAGAAVETSAANLAAAGIRVVPALGVFADPRTLVAGDTRIQARRFVIATGDVPVAPAIPGLDSVPAFTAETIFDNTRKLTHLVIIGAGPMALALGLSYRRLGCDVSIIERAHALPDSDPELAEIALRRLRAEGVTLYESADSVTIQARTQGIGVGAIVAGETLTLDASHILVVAPRRPNLEPLSLASAGVRRSRTDPHQLALVDGLRTSNARIYAVGAAAHPGPSYEPASVAADLVVRAALLGERVTYDPALGPRVTYTDPEIAELGLTEPMARAHLKDRFAVHRVGFGENGRALAGGNAMGVVKLVTDPAGRLLGAGIVGVGAGELAATFALALSKKLKLSELGQFAPPQPSLAELLHGLGAAAAPSGPTPLQRRRLALMRLLR